MYLANSSYRTNKKKVLVIGLKLNIFICTIFGRNTTIHTFVMIFLFLMVCDQKLFDIHFSDNAIWHTNNIYQFKLLYKK